MWEALLFVFPVLNKTTLGDPMSGLDIFIFRETALQRTDGKMPGSEQTRGESR